MSLESLIDTKGDTVDVYRPTWGANADGTGKVASYGSALGTDIKILPDKVTVEAIQKVFGGNEVIDTLGFVIGEPDIQKEDRLKLTSGSLIGTVFRVEVILPQYHSVPHFEMGLETTTETIP